MIEFLDDATWATRGVLPESGGSLDQPRWFMSACNFLYSEQNRVEAESYKR